MEATDPAAWLLDGPQDAGATWVMAHGAGAAMDSPFMHEIAQGVAARGVRVVRFEFPYMHRRRVDGSRPGPDRPPVLQKTLRSVSEQLDCAGRLFVGGKSMGGRIASMLADELGARGLICLGYPFHPPGKPERTRVAHLEGLRTPALFVQGTRDALGNRQEVEDYELSAKIELRWMEDGDHSFKPRKRSGRTLEQALQETVEACVAFIHQQSAG